jgi:diphthamide biosynthesis protein 7
MDHLETQIASQQSLTLDLPPSCLEFSPLLPSYFLVGTYNLQKSEEEAEKDETSAAPQKRSGSIVVYEVAGREMIQVQTVSRPSALLDLRFQTAPGKQDIVGAVSSTGTLEIFRFSSLPSEPPSVTLLGTVRLPGVGEDVLFLQFVWHPTIPDTVAITTSQGRAHILQLAPDYKTSLATDDPVTLHSLEAWCVAMSPTPSSEVSGDSQPFTLYSGGDDSVLQYATCMLEQKPSQNGTSLNVQLPYPAMNVRGHDAGVTAILPLPCGNDIVVTGSYDDQVRVYTIQPLQETYGLRKARVLAEANLGGGVWRLRLIKYDRGCQGEGTGRWQAFILASCMHAGARILRLSGPVDGIGEIELDVLGRFEAHKSMNYASDFQPGSELDGQEELVCVSTSFYDKLLCLWTIKLS